MLELIKMNKKRVGDFIIGAIAIGLFVSYFFTGFIVLPFIAGCFVGERFINPLIFKNDGE